MSDDFIYSLQIMGKGMLGIFTVIFVIMLFVYLMNFLTKFFTERKNRKQQKQA